MSEYLFKIGFNGYRITKKFQVEGVAPPQTILLLRYKNLDKSFFHFVTIHAFNR